MNHHFHIELARQRADELHRAAAMSRLAPKRTHRERRTHGRWLGTMTRRAWTLRDAPDPTR
jgi:hypothetical protein